MNGNLLKRREDWEELFRKEPDAKRLEEARALLTTDASKAVLELEALANAGSVLSMLYLADAFQHGPSADPSKTEFWYRAAYEKGALSAFSGLGGFYYRRGNQRRAEQVFSDGASRGDSVSMYFLAMIYLNHEAQQRKSEIKDLLERSVALGHIRARAQLGLLLMKGRYGITSIPRGFFLHLSSVIDGFRIALRDPDDYRLWA